MHTPISGDDLSELNSYLSYTSQPLYHIDFLYKYFTRDGRQFYSLCDYVHKVADDVISRRRKALVKYVTRDIRRLEFK